MMFVRARGVAAVDDLPQSSVSGGVQTRGSQQGGRGDQERHRLRLDGAVHRALPEGQVLRQAGESV